MKKLFLPLLCLASYAGFSQAPVVPHTTPQTKTIAVPSSTKISSFVGSDIIRIANSGKAAYINIKGDTLFGFDMGILDNDQVKGRFSDGVAAAHLGYGKPVMILNYEGKYMELPEMYKNISDFVDGAALAQRVPQGGKGAVVYLNGIGKEVFPKLPSEGPYVPSPFEARALSEGLRPFNDVSTRQWGYADQEGNIVIPAKFADALPFSDGMAAVSLTKDGYLKWGFIDKKGNVVVEPEYEEFPGFFREGLCPVRIGRDYNKEMAYIDKTGKVVSQTYYACNAFYDGHAVVQTGYGKSAVIDRQFNVVREIPVDFELVANRKTMKHGIEFYDGLAAIGRADNYELFGKIIRADGTVAYETSADMRDGKLGNFYDGKHAFVSYRESEGNRLVRGFINRKGEIVIMFVEEDGAKITANPQKGTWPLVGIVDEKMEYAVKLDVEPAEAGKLFGEGTYFENTKVEINTVSNDKELYKFVGWRDNNDNGKIVATTPLHSIASLGRNEHFTAVYEKRQTYKVIATSNDEGLGSVSGGGTYVPGQKVTLEARILGAAETTQFEGWFTADGLKAFGLRYDFPMPDGDVTIEGRFVGDDRLPYEKPYLALTSNIWSATLTGAGFYDAGTQVPVFASAPEEYKFDGWFEGETKVSGSEKFTYRMPDRNAMLRAKYSKKGGGQPDKDDDKDGDGNGDGNGDPERERPENPKEDMEELFSHWYVATYEFTDSQIPMHKGEEIEMTATGLLGFRSATVKIECPYPDNIVGALSLDLGRERVEVLDGDIAQQAGFFPWIIYEITDREIVMASGAYIFGLELLGADVPLTHIHRVPYVVNRDGRGNITSVVVKGFNPTLKASAPYKDIVFYPVLTTDPMPVNWHLRPEVTYGISWIPDYKEEKALVLDLIWRHIIPEVKIKLQK